MKVHQTRPFILRWPESMVLTGSRSWSSLPPTTSTKRQFYLSMSRGTRSQLLELVSLHLNTKNMRNWFIGTHLVTCQRQPALGCVFKLVSVNDKPKIKLSQDVHKITMPGQKEAFRLYSSDGHALIDLLQRPGEDPPQVRIVRKPLSELFSCFLGG